MLSRPIHSIRCAGLFPTYTGVARVTEFVPSHCFVREPIFRNGFVIGGAVPPGYQGAHLPAGDCEPVIVTSTSMPDILAIMAPSQVTVLAPRGALTLREIMLPTAATHAVESGATMHRIQNGSVFVVGDMMGSMRLVCYFFVEASIFDHVQFSSMLDQSETHIREIWDRKGALRMTPPSLYAVNTHVSTLPEGIHPIVRDVLTVLQERARHVGDDFLVRLVDALSSVGRR